MLGLWFRRDLSRSSGTSALRDDYNRMSRAGRHSGRRRNRIWWDRELQQQDSLRLCRCGLEANEACDPKSWLRWVICQWKHGLLEPECPCRATELHVSKALRGLRHRFGQGIYIQDHLELL